MAESAGRRIRVLDDENKALVPAGTPDQVKGGEISAPSQVYSDGIAPPGANAGLASIRGIAVSRLPEPDSTDKQISGSSRAGFRRQAMSEPGFRSGMLVFPNLTQLDLTGPYEVLARLPGSRNPAAVEEFAAGAHRTWAGDPADGDLRGLSAARPGAGARRAWHQPLLEDQEVLAFLRRAAAAARYVVSVCTGSLVLGAAGLLRGRRAATHWMSRDMLRAFGAEPVTERVVVDGNVFTGGGVTAGSTWRWRSPPRSPAGRRRRRSSSRSNTIRRRLSPRARPKRPTRPLSPRCSARAAPRQRDRAERVARAAAALG